MKNKSKLESLKVKSFVTDMSADLNRTVVGGGENTPLHTRYVTCKTNNVACWLD